MQRPWTWLLLLAFLTAQIYGLHRVAAGHVAHQPAAPIVRISKTAGGLLTRDGRQFLVTATDVYQLVGPASSIRLSSVAAAWEDVPEPSGAGVWRLLVSGTGQVLMGLQGLVYGAPQGTRAVLVDPGTRTALLTSTVKHPPESLSGYTVDRFGWSSVSPTGLFLGTGPEGTGFYALSARSTVTFVGAVKPQVIATFGGSETNLAAVTTSGSLVYGRQILQTMPEAPAWTMPDGTIIGWGKKKVYWWHNGNLAATLLAPLPAARPMVEPGHLVAAYVIGPSRHPRLVILTTRHVVTLPLPYEDVRVLGWYHQAVLFAVMSGADTGTYRVLVMSRSRQAK